MKKDAMLKTDLEILEKSLAFHKGRRDTWDKPKARKMIRPYDDVNPNILIPSLEKIIKSIKTELKKA